MDWRRTLVLLAGAMVGSASAQLPPLVVVKKVAAQEGAQPEAAAADVATAMPFEFMGITLGAPLVPECPREQIPHAGAVYDLSAIESACWATSSMRPDSKTNTRNNTNLTVVPPSSKRPTGTRQVTASVVDGAVVGLSISTDGFVHAKELFEQLKQKLGEPTLQDEVQVTSGVGATFAAPRAVWELPGAYVKFNGIVQAVNSGLIVVYTPAERARVLAREKENAKTF